MIYFLYHDFIIEGLGKYKEVAIFSIEKGNELRQTQRLATS